MRLGWIRDEDGVITVYANRDDGSGAAVADFWINTLADGLKISRSEAKLLQQKFAELMVDAFNEGEN